VLPLLQAPLPTQPGSTESVQGDKFIVNDLETASFFLNRNNSMDWVSALPSATNPDSRTSAFKIGLTAKNVDHLLQPDAFPPHGYALTGESWSTSPWVVGYSKLLDTDLAILNTIRLPVNASLAFRTDPAAEVLSETQISITAMSKSQAIELFQRGEQRSMEEVKRKLALNCAHRDTPLTAQELQRILQNIAHMPGQTSYRPAALRISITADQEAADLNRSGGFLDLTLVPMEGEVVGRRLLVDITRFNQQLVELNRQVGRQSALEPENAESPTRKLYDLLIRPLEAELSSRGITSVLLSVDKGLQGIPYAALHDGHSYVGEQLAFSLTPSISLMPLDAPPSGPDERLLGLGASEFELLAPLPLVPQEIERLTSASTGRVYLNDHFTPEVLLERIANPAVRHVHVATHADFLPGGPSESKLYTGTGPVRLKEFASLRQRRKCQPLELFSLSACRTALGDPDSELGFAGLALQAGSRSAIGSLWYVDDIATSAFFVQFYRFLDQGMPKAEAMKATRRLFARGGVQLEGNRLLGENGTVLLDNLLPHQREHASHGLEHPYFWSGITLLGAPW
jgi:CHAT domain-containing protein